MAFDLYEGITAPPAAPKREPLIPPPGTDTPWAGVDLDTARGVAGTQVPGVASSVLSGVLPDPNFHYIPGVVEGVAALPGVLAQVGRAVANKVGANLGEVPEWLTAPGTALANWQDKIFTNLPHATPPPGQEEEYERGKEMAQMIGSAVPLAPGSVLSSLPRGLRTIAALSVPTTSHLGTNLAIAGGIAPAASALVNADQAKAAEPTDPLYKGITAPFADAAQATGITPAPQDPLYTGITAPDDAYKAFHEEGSTSSTIGDWVAGALGLGGAALAAWHLHRLPLRVTAAARDARMADPAYSLKADAFNQAQAEADLGRISNAEGQRTTAPLPGASDSIPTTIKNEVLDDNAAAARYMKDTAENPTVADRLISQRNETLDHGAWNSILREFLRTGRDRISGIRVQPPERFFDDVAALDPADRQVLAKGLDSANEINNRDINITKRRLGNDATFDFPNTPTYGPPTPGGGPSLDAMKQEMLSNPRTAPLAYRYWELVRGIFDIGEARNFYTPAEASQFRTTRPNYRPDVMADGELVHALADRDPRMKGLYQQNSTPWHALAQYVEGSMREFELNDQIRRPWTEHQMDVQQRYPNSAQFLREANVTGQNPSMSGTPQITGSRGEPVYLVRDGTGTKFIHSANPEWRDWMAVRNVNKANTFMGIADMSRRTVQAFSTGVQSLASLGMFPLRHIARAYIMLPVNRPAGTAISLSDALMQMATRPIMRAVTGNPEHPGIGQRIIPDPTTSLGMMYAPARRGFDAFVNMVADALAPNGMHFTGRMLGNTTTPSYAQALSDWLKNRYLSSATHEMTATGAAADTMETRMRPPAFGAGAPEGLRDIRSVSAALSPRLFMPDSFSGNVKSAMLNLQRAFVEPYSALMNAPNEFYYRLNRVFNPGMDTAKLAYESRNILGNPSLRGAGETLPGRLVRNYLSMVPYANVGLQATGRSLRALNETPIGSTAALFGNLGSLALLSLYTAMRQPDALQYLSDKITTAARASNFYFFTGNTPEDHIEVPISQHFSWAYPIVLDAMSKALNVAAAHHDADTFDGLYSFMKDWFSEHIENSTMESSLHGAARTLEGVNFPSVFNVGSSLLGGRLNFDLSKVVHDIHDNNFGFNTFTSKIATDPALPNHPIGDNFFEGENTKVWHYLISSVLGAFAGTADLLANAGHYYDEFKAARPQQNILENFLDTAGQLGQDAWQRVKDQNPQLNTWVWHNQARESIQSPIEELTSREVHNMAAAGGPRSPELKEGTTGGTHPLPVTPQLPEDRHAPPPGPMRELYNTVNAEHRWINSQYIQAINERKKQMADAEKQPMNNTQRREWEINQTRWISDRWRDIHAYIQDKSQQISNAYGHRIYIGDPIDWKGTIDQFPLLN